MGVYIEAHLRNTHESPWMRQTNGFREGRPDPGKSWDRLRRLRALIGSASDSVVRHAHCPVPVVRYEKDLAA